MSELRPSTPARRPDTARPREAVVPQVEPPSTAELEAIQHQLVTLPALDGAEVNVDEALAVTFVRGPGSGPDLTYAAMPRWNVETWDESLGAVRDHMRSQGLWPSMLVCDRLDRPLGLPAELRRRGWMPAVSEMVMWVGHASVVPHLDPSLRIEAVQPRAAALHERLEREIFGLDASTAERRGTCLAQALEAGSLRAWIVWLGDEPVAVARLAPGSGCAALQGIGVVDGRRGQGLGTLVTTVATRAGLALGHRIVWLSVQDENVAARRVYERLGYRPLLGWSRWLETEVGPSR